LFLLHPKNIKATIVNAKNSFFILSSLIVIESLKKIKLLAYLSSYATHILVLNIVKYITLKKME